MMPDIGGLRAGAALLALALCGCAAARTTRAGHPAPAGQMATAMATRTADPGGSPGEAVWHLRAGLNVAALSCRGPGREHVAGAYGRMLSRHRAVLASAYQGELRRYGVQGLDRHLTQLYNRFSNQRSPELFCRTASGVATRAVAMDSAALVPAAPRLLAELEHPAR